MKSGFVVECVFDTHMGNGHAGLLEIASRKRIKMAKLEPGQFVVFINHKHTAFKAFGAFNAILHVKMQEGRRVTAEVLRSIPKIFSPELHWDWSDGTQRRIAEALGIADLVKAEGKAA